VSADAHPTAGRLALLVGGVVACSTAAPMIRAADTDPLAVAAWRCVFAAAILAPWFLRARARHPEVGAGRILRAALPGAVLLATHFWSWNVGVYLTTVANASLIVNLTAVSMPLVVRIMFGDRLRRLELIGTAVALVGTALLAIQDYRLEMEHFWGDLVCFGSMFLFTVYLAWGRRSVHMPDLWLYLPPVYGIAGLLCLAGGAAGLAEVIPGEPGPWLWFVALALVPTIVGHSILNRSMQILRSQTVAIVNLGQFISAGTIAWSAFDELPGWAFVPAAAMVVAGALIAIRARR